MHDANLTWQLVFPAWMLGGGVCSAQGLLKEAGALSSPSSTTTDRD